MLEFLFQFVKQNNYSILYVTGIPGTMSNQPRFVTDHWQEPGNTATYQPYSTGINFNVVNRFLNFQGSDAVVEDASYIRLKNIALTYSLPEMTSKNIRVSVFLRGQNLLTFTGYEGFDPESGYPNSLPPLRVLTTGLQLSF